MTSEEDGKFGEESSKRVERDEIVAVIRDAPAPVVNTQYLGDEFGMSPDSMGDRLDELAEDGVLEHTEARERGHLWWLSVEAELDE
ncbi:hypothetical protein [Haladaptatus sp. NG-SE-30]